MRIALLSPGYPSSDSPYDWAFVHARAKLYRAREQDVAAFVIGSPRQWQFEGICAERNSADSLRRAIDSWGADVVALHGPYFRLIELTESLERPCAVWVHGHEALWHWGGFRHGATGTARALRALKTPLRLVWQLWKVRQFLSRHRHVVFVSEWMRKAAERHTVRQFSHAAVIPNPVDTTVFEYVWDRRNLSSGVTARSLNSKKYGIDVAIRAISVAGSARLSVLGTGSLEPALRRLAGQLTAPVTFSGSFVPHGEMPRVYANHGFFLAASRVEAQGVAMCEAMACGLPVIATNVGGIPEFVRHNENGFLSPPEDSASLASDIRRLTEDAELAESMSQSARMTVEKTCSHHVVVERELSVLRAAAYAA